MKRTLFFIALFFLLLFTGCSTKEVYVPKKLGSDWHKYAPFKYDIVDTSSNVALLENRKVLTRSGVVDFVIPKDRRVITKSDGWIITASIDGNLSLISASDTKMHKEFALKKTVAGASVKGSSLAVIFADNEIALYDINSKKLLFQEQESQYMTVDSRIVNPLFMRGLLLFATLDGKVVFVNLKTKKRLRTAIVSSADNFNNIISLHLLENRVITATNYQILSLAQKEVRAKYDIRAIVYDDANIYLATKQGEIISLNTHLDLLSKIKLPFAHFYDMIVKDGKLYILEKGGYMIIVNAKSFDYSVHRLHLDTHRANSKVYRDFLKSNGITRERSSTNIENSYIFNDTKSFILDRVKVLLP